MSGDRFAMVFLASAPPAWYSASEPFERVLGSLGQGPGEFGFPSYVRALPGDSLAVFDLSSVTVLAPDGAFVRTVRMAVIPEDVSILSWPQQVAVSAMTGDPASAGFSVHIFDLSGSNARHVRSVIENTPYFPNREPEYRRVTAPHPNGGFIAARARSYRFSQWSADLDEVQRWERHEDWAPDNPFSVTGGPEHAPAWELVDVHVDAEGLLWVYLHVGREDWSETWASYDLESFPRNGEIAAAGTPAPYELMTTRVEVIDIENGTLLATRDFDEYVHLVLEDGRVILADEDEVGVPLVSVGRLVLSR